MDEPNHSIRSTPYVSIGSRPYVIKWWHMPFLFLRSAVGLCSLAVVIGLIVAFVVF